MKAYKITGKLGDICSFVGGNEVKKGDMVYLHSESDMKQQRVSKPQGNEHMSIEAMKQALEALELGLEYAKGEQFENAQRFKGYEHLAPNDSDSVKLIEDAITSLRTAIEQAEKQEPVAWLAPRYEGGHENLAVVDKKEFGAFQVYTTPQPQRPWVGLTDEEIKKFWRDATVKPCYTSELIDTFAKTIEAKLKEKNT